MAVNVYTRILQWTDYQYFNQVSNISIPYVTTSLPREEWDMMNYKQILRLMLVFYYPEQDIDVHSLEERERK